jgi:multidrug efflux pump subunit AcrA (membrane-fusion protein)
VVGPDTALRTRPVEVLRIEGETVFVAGGLVPGERVVARVPSAFVEGMTVRVGSQPVAAAAAP